jgi:hypothetical protein
MPKTTRQPKGKRYKQLDLLPDTVMPVRSGSPILAFRIDETLLVRAERKFKTRAGVNDACREFLARAVRK